MIFGIGVDCTQVERIEKSMQKQHFVNRVFSAQEQAQLAGLQGKRANESAAACFAAKEAFMKAAGTGLGGFALTDISALRKKTGAPYYCLTGTAAEFCKKNKLNAHVSITHENGLAIAFAILEA